MDGVVMKPAFTRPALGNEHRPALVALARTSGFDLDAGKLVMRPLGPGARRTAA